MNRVEVNCKTGKTTVIKMTKAEEDQHILKSAEYNAASIEEEELQKELTLCKLKAELIIAKESNLTRAEVSLEEKIAHLEAKEII